MEPQNANQTPSLQQTSIPENSPVAQTPLTDIPVSTPVTFTPPAEKHVRPVFIVVLILAGLVAGGYTYYQHMLSKQEVVPIVTEKVTVNPVIECFALYDNSSTTPACVGNLNYTTASVATSSTATATIAFVAGEGVSDSVNGIIKYNVISGTSTVTWYEKTSRDPFTFSGNGLEVYSFGDNYVYQAQSAGPGDAVRRALSYKVNSSRGVDNYEYVYGVRRTGATPILYSVNTTASSSKISFYDLSPEGFKEKISFTLPEKLFAEGNVIGSPCNGEPCGQGSYVPFEYDTTNTISVLYYHNADEGTTTPKKIRFTIPK